MDKLKPDDETLANFNTTVEEFTTKIMNKAFKAEWAATNLQGLWLDSLLGMSDADAS